MNSWAGPPITKYSQDPGNLTLFSRVGAKNEGEISSFGCEIFLKREPWKFQI